MEASLWLGRVGIGFMPSVEQVHGPWRRRSGHNLLVHDGRMLHERRERPFILRLDRGGRKEKRKEKKTKSREKGGSKRWACKMGGVVIIDSLR